MGNKCNCDVIRAEGAGAAKGDSQAERMEKAGKPRKTKNTERAEEIFNT